MSFLVTEDLAKGTPVVVDSCLNLSADKHDGGAKIGFTTAAVKKGQRLYYKNSPEPGYYTLGGEAPKIGVHSRL